MKKPFKKQLGKKRLGGKPLPPLYPSKPLLSADNFPPKKFIYKYIPNTLTALRLMSTPLCIWALASNHPLVTFWIFLTASITDCLDGYLARRWDALSKFGQVADPVADKILIMALYTTLGLQGFVPWWLTVIVWVRDIFILAIGGLIMLAPRPTPPLLPHYLGKISTTLHMGFISLILINNAGYGLFRASGVGSPVMLSFLYIVASVTIISGILYGHTAFRLLRRA